MISLIMCRVPNGQAAVKALKSYDKDLIVIEARMQEFDHDLDPKQKAYWAQVRRMCQ